MAFQTSVLRHGEWVTQTVSLGDAVSRANAPVTSRPGRPRVDRTPDYGIITRTIVESPVTRWILPARLRSAQHMDVAIIGDRYVHISELDRDGRLREVIRYTHFQSTIINAKVIGSPPEHTHSESQTRGRAKVKVEEDAVPGGDDIATANGGLTMDYEPDVPRPSAPTATHILPPQQLILVLESGECVLLFLRPKSTAEEYEFVTVTSPSPYRHRFNYPGFHTTVDPSSRYLALGCTESLFVVYELASQRDLAQAYARGEALQLFKTVRPRAVQGDILHMHFLYPRPHDDYHIILLLLVERNGDTRMITYDWEAGDDLNAVLAEEKRGQPVPPLHRAPLLVVPLTVCSAFFAISTNTIGVCKNVLDAPAEFENIVVEGHAPSSSFQGDRLPIWTAWTRPYRLPMYSTERDNIYLAREDGVIMFLDIDSDNILGASVEIGKFECNIGTSFCSLFDDFNDILIMGGHCGPGTISQVRPRQPNVKLDTIPNWSPISDIVTTDEFAVCDGLVGLAGHKMVPWNKRPKNAYSSPDRVFAACGRGPTSMITEFRNGLRANIGLDIDYETPVKQSWIFSVPSLSSDDAASDNAGYHMLLSLVDKSVALHLSADLTQASQLDENTTPYDLTSRTVTAVQVPDGTVVQVTETCLALVHPSQSVQHRYEDIFHAQQLLIVDACVQGNYVAISGTVGSVFQIHLLQIDKSGGVRLVNSVFPSGDVTCLCLGMVSASPCIIAGLLLPGRPSVAIFAAADEHATPSYIDLNSEELCTLRNAQLRDAGSSESVLLEALSSIALLHQGEKKMAIVGGTRGGEVVTLLLDEAGKVYAVHSEKFGVTATQVSLIEDPRLRQAILVVCDGRVSLQAGLDLQTAKFHFMHMVYAVDAGDGSKTPPYISAASIFGGELPEHPTRTQLVLTSVSRIMLAELDTLPGPANRFLPVGGTITKLLYSHVLNSLVAGVTDKEGRATIRFIDPDTGEDISYATDKFSEKVDFVSGLGKPDDKILGLDEWSYERDGDKWVFLLVSTKCGRVIVLSTTPRPNDGGNGGSTAARPGGQPERRGKIQYWTRFKRPRSQEPVYSVVGWNNNVFYCVGATLHWDKLDLVDKKLRTMGKFELGSHATSLRVVNSRIVALTDRDSVEIINIESGATGVMTLVHADSYWREAAHIIEARTEIAGDKLNTSVLLASHWNESVVGLWVPWQHPGRDCSVVFRASVPMSVRKLVRGRTRPSWQQARREIQYGLVPSTPDGAEILGACVDGSLQHFTIINLPAFMVLHLVEELANDAPGSVWTGMAAAAAADEESVSSDDELDDEPPTGLAHGRQIDGGVLQRCLESRVLESLFSNPANVAKLARRLNRLDGGRWTAGLNGEGDVCEKGTQEISEDRKAKYLALLYDILEYYVAPAL